MRPSASLLRLAMCLSSLAPLASAWPGWLPDLDTLVVRQDEGGGDGGDSSSTAAETGATATKSDPPATDTAKPESTGEETGSRTGTAKGTKETKEAEKTKSIAADAAVGGVNIMNPATSAAATALFKIGDNITLGWNYTGLEATPTAIDVLLSCSTASETWTLTNNMTFETDVSYVWNSAEQAGNVEQPLLMEMYTLIIKDSEAEVSDVPSPGMLGSNSDFTFGLYHKVSYTPWAEWECTGCNAATASFDTQVVKLAFTMCIITVFTFTWFVTGWGIH